MRVPRWAMADDFGFAAQVCRASAFRKTLALSIALVLWPSLALAETQPLAWPSHRTLAARLSDAAVLSNITLDIMHSFRADDRGAAFSCQAWRMGLTVGTTTLVKAIVHRERPDGSNDDSFWSGHTANAMAASGWKVSVGIPIAIGAGYGRAAANRHYLSDIAVGAAVGWLAGKVCAE